MSEPIKFLIWIQEEGYELTEKRYRLYLAGKYYYIWDLYKKFKLQIGKPEPIRVKSTTP